MLSAPPFTILLAPKPPSLSRAIVFLHKREPCLRRPLQGLRSQIEFQHSRHRRDLFRWNPVCVTLDSVCMRNGRDRNRTNIDVKTILFCLVVNYAEQKQRFRMVRYFFNRFVQLKAVCLGKN